MKTTQFNFSREQITTGILHFGVGNFHRAHLEYYTNKLLENPTQSAWGVCGAMLMPQDEMLYNKLANQNNIYSLTICGRDGRNTTEWIGSLKELLWSGLETDKIIAKVASPQTKIITLTITEGGYNLESEAVQNDLKNPATPRSVFGIVAEGLRRRIAEGGGAITILSCDNLQHNGDTCKRIFTSFFEMQDTQLAAWVKESVTFPNSMVDRITPATTPADVERINTNLDKYDAAPVYCEDFIQWVVEDNFAAGRPEWDSVGVEFTDDVAPYENMKLSLLNASHTLLSYPSLLSGYRKVDGAMCDERVIKFVREFMDLDASPFVPAPANTDLELYKKTLIERFANSAVSDQISRLCGDGASKFPVYVMPIAKKMIAKGSDMSRIAYLIAAYRHYLKYQVDDRGVEFEIFEPQLTEADMQIIKEQDAVKFLAATPFAMVDLAAESSFVELYLRMVDSISSVGAMATMEQVIGD